MTMTKLQNYKSYVRTMGSKAYGCDVPGSDFDLRGFYVQPWEDIVDPMSDANGQVIRSAEEVRLGVSNLPPLEDLDVCIHSARRIFNLWAKGSPEAFEMLIDLQPNACGYAYNRAPDKISREAEVLLCKNKHIFFSMGFVRSSLGFLEGDRKKAAHAKENYDQAKAQKLVANMVRLSGNLVDYLHLQHFELDNWAVTCRDIRSGEIDLHEAMKMVDSNLSQAKKLRARSFLPKDADPEQIKSLFSALIMECYGPKASSPNNQLAVC